MSKISPYRKFITLAIMLTLLLIISSKTDVFAQPTQALDEDWRDSDYGFISEMLDSDIDNNIYVLGDTSDGDYLIIKKFNPAGDLLWQTTYNPVERLRGVWIAVDNNNDPIILASIITGGNGDPSGWLTQKYDTNGNVVWTNSLPGAFADARRVEVDANNDIYVSGRMFQINPFGNTTLDSVLIKYNPDGGVIWTEVFDNNSAVDEPFSMVISPDNSRIGIAGKSGNLFMALMYDPDGNLLWSNTDPTIYPANDLAFGPGNISYFATGTYSPGDPNPYPMAIAKFDSSGNQLWVQSYAEGYRTYRMLVDQEGNILATGIAVNGYLDWITFKTDADGNLLWSQRYDGGRNNDEIPNMLLLDDVGSVYVTGKGGPNPSSGVISYIKGVVAKYASDGTPQWAVWDDYAGGKAIRLEAENSLASQGFGYLVITHYTQTGLPDIVPAAPTNLSGYYDFDGANYIVNLNFTDNANNEFWVEVERCTGVGCTDFVKIGQTLGENATGFTDEDVSYGSTYNYRVRAQGFIGASESSNTIEIVVAPGNPPAAPSNLTANMEDDHVALDWQDNSDNENQFYIERCQGAGCSNFTGVGTADANITHWADYNTSAGESYSYRVRAWNSNGFSGYSNIATIFTPDFPNTAPVLDFIGDRTVDELSSLVFTATASDGDVPGQTLTFSLEAGAPSGASIDPVSGVFSWTPGEAQGPGVYTVTVVVTDDGIPPLSDAETFNVTVNEVNPTLQVNAGSDQTVQEGQPIHFAGAYTDTLQSAQAPSEAMIYWDFGDGTSATGTLTPTHTYGDNGLYTITLTVTDTFGTVGSDSLQVSTPNVTPSLTNIPDQTVMINHPLTFPVVFTDPGWRDSHTVAIEWAPGFTETINLAAGVTEYSSQHIYTQDGQFVVAVMVTDHDGASDSQTLIIDVEAYRVFFPQIQR